MKLSALTAPILIALSIVVVPLSEAATSSHSLLARGRYLVTVGGCNDCHTAGYP